MLPDMSSASHISKQNMRRLSIYDALITIMYTCFVPTVRKRSLISVIGSLYI